MRGRLLRSLCGGVCAGLIVAVCSTFAHASAGGAVTAPEFVGLSAVAIALATALAFHVRMTFARVVAATSLSQPVMHVVLGHHPTSGMPDHMAGHDMANMANSGPGAATELGMIAAHSAVAVVTAVVLTWGLRWLRSMPTIGRAVVTRSCGAITPIALPAEPMPDVVCAVNAPLAVLFAWDNRGPPH